MSIREQKKVKKKHGYKNHNIRRRSPCHAWIARLRSPRLHGLAPQCGAQPRASIFRRPGDLFRPEGKAGGSARLLHCVWRAVWPARSGGFCRRRTGLLFHDHSGNTGFGNIGPSDSPHVRSRFSVSRIGLETGHTDAQDALTNERVPSEQVCGFSRSTKLRGRRRRRGRHMRRSAAAATTNPSTE